MITRFTVKGFKSLASTSVELGRVNVFVGANGSGKSNLLEAIGVMGAAAFGSVEPETLRYRGVRPGVPALYKSSFRKTRFRRIITIEASAPNARYKVGLDNVISNPTSKWKVHTESLYWGNRPIARRSPRASNIFDAAGVREPVTSDRDQSIAKLGLARQANAGPAHRLLSDLEAYAIYAPTTPVLRGVAQEDVSREPLGLSGGGLPEALIQLIDNAKNTLGTFDLDDVWEMIEWAKSVRAVSAYHVPLSPAVKTSRTVLRFRDKFMRPDRGVLSAYDASEGALYVLFMLALVSHQKSPRVFAVDNFDHALHPRLASQLMRLLSQTLVEDEERQLLATTHNPLVLDGLDLRNDQVRLFAVDRAGDGTTQVNRVTLSEDLLEQLDKGLPLSRLWLMGRLGGVPRLL